MKTRVFAVATALVLVALANSAIAQTPKPGGKITIGITNALRQLDPHKTNQGEDYPPTFWMYNGLTRVLRDRTVAPDLATSWKSTPDLKKWTVSLRKGVLFHNGREMVADDVVASFRRVQDRATGSLGRGMLTVIESATAPDKYTVEFALNAPYAEFPTVLGTIQAKIVPRDLVDSLSWCVTHYTNNQEPGAVNFADDVVTMETHSGTHMDGIGHCWTDNTMWNGRDAAHATSYGLEWAGIQNVPGVVGRGVMLDLPRFKGVSHLDLGEVATVEMMEGCARAQGVDIRPGDVLLVRTGWYTVFQSDRALWDQGQPGPDPSCTGWLKAKDVIALGADSAGVEATVFAKRTATTPRLHTTALRDLGVYLMEHLNLEELARDRVHEFLFVAAPLKLTRATGAPFAPLAMV